MIWLTASTRLGGVCEAHWNRNMTNNTRICKGLLVLTACCMFLLGCRGESRTRDSGKKFEQLEVISERISRWKWRCSVPGKVDATVCAYFYEEADGTQLAYRRAKQLADEVLANARSGMESART